MKYILDPREILKQHKPDPLQLALLDAFDAATNGMENPEAMIAIQHSKEAFLQSWIELVYAIRALYEEDSDTCLLHTRRIHDSSPPATLKPLFMAWIQASNFNKATNMLEKSGEVPLALLELFGSLFSGPHPAEALAEQAEEALNHAMTEQYEHLIYRILRMLQDQKRSDGPLLAVRYAVYCLNQLHAAGYAKTEFFSLIIRALGHADGFYALGVSLLDHDLEAAQSALRAALEAQDGVFIDTYQTHYIQQLLNLLKSTSTKKTKQKRPAKQLELF